MNPFVRFIFVLAVATVFAGLLAWAGIISEEEQRLFVVMGVAGSTLVRLLILEDRLDKAGGGQ